MADLLAELAAGPNLHGAACARPSTRELFDSGAPEAVDAALAVCATCPALRPCQRWALSLRPKQRPGPMVGGMIVTQRTARMVYPGLTVFVAYSGSQGG